MRKKLKPFLIGVVFILTFGLVSAARLIHNANLELDRIAGLHHMDTMRRGVLDSFWSVYNLVSDVAKVRDRDIDTIIASVEEIHASTKRCLECHKSDKMVERLKILDRQMAAFEQSLSFFITTSANNQRVERLSLEAVQRGSEVLRSVEELATLSSEQMKRSVYSTIDRLNFAAYVFYATLAAIFGFGVLLTLTLVRSISKPVKVLIEGTREIAGGNLGYSIGDLGDDEFGELAKHFDRMSEELKSSYVDLAESNRQLKIEVAEHQRAEFERQKLLEELIHARKMEAVGTLAGGIAHEFNNLLQSIQISAELMSLSAADNAKLQKHLGVILNSSARGADLTKRLLTFSRKVESEMRPLNLNQAVEQLSQMVGDAMPSSISFSAEIDARPIMVMGDLTAIEQILLNLVLNARDAMPNGGNLKVSVRLLPRESWLGVAELPSDSPGVALLEVSDSGSGMDEAIRQKIFEPFFTTKSVGFGTGLGLAITYGVVQSHGGLIDCTSSVGQGTVFSIRLPAINPISS